jgi:sulfite exporter TauE/SafE
MTGWLGLLASAAFLAGLMGGVHCAAMCGGWVAATCREKSRGLAYPLAYNVGRIASYAVAGALAGALGEAGVALRGGVLAQQVMLVVASTALFVVALYVAGVAPFMRVVEVAGVAVWRRLQPYSRHFLPVNSLPRALGLGALWGWLPCGMVYMTLLSAVATGNAWHGALVMLAFGVGTLPNLIAVSIFFERARAWSRSRSIRIGAGLLVASLGMLGLLKAAHPAAFAADGLLCHVVPGLSAYMK